MKYFSKEYTGNTYGVLSVGEDELKDGEELDLDGFSLDPHAVRFELFTDPIVVEDILYYIEESEIEETDYKKISNLYDLFVDTVGGEDIEQWRDILEDGESTDEQRELAHSVISQAKAIIIKAVSLL